MELTIPEQKFVIKDDELIEPKKVLSRITRELRKKVILEIQSKGITIFSKNGRPRKPEAEYTGEYTEEYRDKKRKEALKRYYAKKAG